jgi:hypothetical protein
VFASVQLRPSSIIVKFVTFSTVFSSYFRKAVILPQDNTLRIVLRQDIDVETTVLMMCILAAFENVDAVCRKI